MKKKQILIIGNYNAGNFGDDALLEASLPYFKKYFSDYKCLVVAPKKPYDYPTLPFGLRSFITFKWIRTLYAYCRSEYLVFAGGGILNPEEYKSLFIWGLQIMVAKLFKMKVVLLANSVPFSNSKFLLYLLKKVDFITVRDKASFDFLNKLGLEISVRQTMDLVFLSDFDSKVEDLEFDTDEFITLNLRQYKGIPDNYLEDIFLELVNKITLKSNCFIYLLPFEKSDIKFLRSLNNLVAANGKVFLLPFESDVLITALKKSKLNISQRLHPSLFSIGLKKDFLALSYSDKVKALISDLGYEDKIVDLKAEIDPAKIAKIVTDCLSEKDSNLLVTNENELQKKAEDNFRLLKLFLEQES